MVERLRAGQRQADTAVNLVPSENRLSPLARHALNSDFYNRYFFNGDLDPEFWQFRGGQSVATVEVELADSLRRLSGATHVNTRPISGMSAMMMAMAGLGGPPGGSVVSIELASGGHYATADIARRLGFESHTVPVCRGRVDEQRLVSVLRAAPQLVYLDLQNSRHELDVAQIAELVRTHSPQTLLHVDCSHTLGLVLGGALANPLDAGADSAGGSTHKTFPGPHKGVVLTRRPELHQRLLDAQMTMLSSHHFAETLALAIATAEFELHGRAYAAQVVANSRLFGKELADDGFDVVTDEGGHITSTHQIWVRVGTAEETDRFSQGLYEQGIRANVQVDLPDVPGPVLRLGLSELTFVGGREAAVHALAAEFRSVRDGRADGKGSRRVLERCEAPFYVTELP